MRSGAQLAAIAASITVFSLAAAGCVSEPETSDYPFVATVSNAGAIEVSFALCLGDALESLWIAQVPAGGEIEYRADEVLDRNRILTVALSAAAFNAGNVPPGLEIAATETFDVAGSDPVSMHVLIRPALAADAWIDTEALSGAEPGSYLLTGSVAQADELGGIVGPAAATRYLEDSCEVASW